MRLLVSLLFRSAGYAAERTRTAWILSFLFGSAGYAAEHVIVVCLFFDFTLTLVSFLLFLFLLHIVFLSFCFFLHISVSFFISFVCVLSYFTCFQFPSLVGWYQKRPFLVPLPPYHIPVCYTPLVPHGMYRCLSLL